MIFRLIMILFLCVDMVAAMNTPQKFVYDDVPSNFRELMPRPFIHSAELASEGKFDQIIDYWVDLNEGNKPHAEELCVNLKKNYVEAKEEFASQRSTFDASITEKDYIYDQLLRYFWWSHYYPVYEGLIEDDTVPSSPE